MAFDANIPQPTDKLKDSQADLLANFQSLNTNWQVNHVDFNAGATAGKHKFVELINQGSDPAGAAAEGTVYSKQSSTSGSAQTELFWRRDAGSIIEFTARNAAASGFTQLPSGIYIIWGQANSVVGTTTVTFGPTPTMSVGILQVIVSPRSTAYASGYVYWNGTQTTTSFNVTASAISTFSYIAIGY